MSERIAAIKAAIEHAAGKPAEHVESIHVVEKTGDKTVWEGVVEVFTLLGHPQVHRAYGWSIGKAPNAQYKTVLGVYPIDSPNAAVRASIVSEAKNLG